MITGHVFVIQLRGICIRPRRFEVGLGGEANGWFLFKIGFFCVLKILDMSRKTFGVEGTFSKGCQSLILYSVRFDGSHDHATWMRLTFTYVIRCSTVLCLGNRLVLSLPPLLLLARSDSVNFSYSFRPYSYRTSLATYPLTACWHVNE